VRNGELRTYELTPGDVGVTTHDLEAVLGGDSAENARIAIAVLEGEAGARRDIVIANAGAALYVAGLAASIREGVERAWQAIAAGAARAKLEELVAVSREVAG
jgi:anthranilate phosphoribosyltransferase